MAIKHGKRSKVYMSHDFSRDHSTKSCYSFSHKNIANTELNIKLIEYYFQIHLTNT